MNKESRIFVAGHGGLLGSAVCRQLKKQGFKYILTLARKDTDYLNYSKLAEFFKKESPEYIIQAAGLTGGIIANKTRPAEFLFKNTMVQNHFFQLATEHKAKALVFFSSSCVYPKHATQPMKETQLLTGPIEETSQAYAMAKMNGMYACKAYNEQYKSTKMICLLPNSIYGLFDNFDPESSHVMGALIRKIHEAKRDNLKSVTLWGSGTPKREFVNSDDVADATIFALKNLNKFENEHYNVGSGSDYSISELAHRIAQIVGYEGEIQFDTSKPDGTPRKILDSSKINLLGWMPKKSLSDGIKETYNWFVENY